MRSRVGLFPFWPRWSVLPAVVATLSLGGATEIHTSAANHADYYQNCTGDTQFISDGDCDAENNNETCGFDGGDCCSCTCIHGTKWQCGANAFNCVDPDASCSTEAEDNTPTNNDGTSSNNAGDGEVDGDREESGLERYPECVSGSADFIGDSYCDPQNNSQACDYDGGDCCSCTCVDTSAYRCADTPFVCKDPNAECRRASAAPRLRVPRSSVLAATAAGSVAAFVGVALIVTSWYRSAARKKRLEFASSVPEANSSAVQEPAAFEIDENFCSPAENGFVPIAAPRRAKLERIVEDEEEYEDETDDKVINEFAVAEVGLGQEAEIGLHVPQDEGFRSDSDGDIDSDSERMRRPLSTQIHSFHSSRADDRRLNHVLFGRRARLPRVCPAFPGGTGK